MRRYLYPQIRKSDICPILKVVGAGAILAGIYGVVHDQITFTISPEYFTKFKFTQFWYADLGFGNRVFAGAVGFIASFWVGLAAGWFLGRRFIPGQALNTAVNNLVVASLLVLVTAVVFAFGGWIYGQLLEPNAVLPGWAYVLKSFRVHDGIAFVRVAYIHNASYLGALFGFVLTYFLIKPKQKNSTDHLRCD